MKNFLLTLTFVLATALSFASTDSKPSISEEEAAFMECFDFNDSCGGSWEVCHENVSTVDLIAFLWEWDGGCQ
ncbi:hypothetical protein [Aureivirga sp. CE67]|uniref:hypothetical protein n=1 Tax=Aureivirga sp. CE67 TaxID=1788983 RepID=UPI0018C9F228|nr:hypothetical protein [Aureivirga sp. CE67]